MKDTILSYREMCDKEDVQTLQRGMNFRLNPNYSVILMSQRKNAPYNDSISPDGLKIEYEGHDIPKIVGISDPKSHDQPRYTKLGKLTQNGLFAKAVDDFKKMARDPEVIRVYEKLFSGIWSDKGFFKLINYEVLRDNNNRYVFRFLLEETEIEFLDENMQENRLRPRSRIIPSKIKKEVWIRDKGRCVICSATDELHFDHDLPYSKGGTSITVNNVRILCARHNIQKSDKIE
ncbi:MAG: HNH endonuclease [bacterium]